MTEEGCGNSAILTRIRTFNAPKTDIEWKKNEKESFNYLAGSNLAPLACKTKAIPLS